MIDDHGVYGSTHATRDVYATELRWCLTRRSWKRLQRRLLDLTDHLPTLEEGLAWLVATATDQFVYPGKLIYQQSL